MSKIRKVQMHRSVLMSSAVLLGAAVTAMAGVQQPPAQPARASSQIRGPVKTKDVKPVYPPEAQSAHVQGVVIIEATIGPTGKVEDVKILRSIPLLDAAALDAVRQWEFTPTLINGVPSPTVITLTVNFALGRNPSPAATAQSQPPARMLTFETVTDPDGTWYVFEIPADDVDRRLPRWDQRLAPDPPLSASEARRAAEAWLKARHPQLEAIELSSSSLLRVSPQPASGTCGADRCWYYRLYFTPVVADRARPAGSGQLTAIVLLDGSIVEPRVESSRRLALTTAPSSSQPSSVQGTPVDRGPGGVYRGGDTGIVPPRILRQVQAQYTDEARSARIQGTVVMEVVVNADGTIGEARIMRSLDPVHGLDKAALEAATQWRFAPATRLGVPVSYLVTMDMTFSVR